MRSLAKTVVRFLKAEDGPTAVEYAVMCALLVVVALGAVATLQSNAKTSYTNVGTNIGTGS
jgi:pilus assembly protein Flp/PilA